MARAHQTNPTSTLTRDAVLHELRGGPRTVEQIASTIGITLNGVRAHLATLERDGMVVRAGVRRATGAGKPPLLFAITPAAELTLSRAYPGALSALVDALVARTNARERRSLFAAAGEILGGGAASAGSDAPQAVAKRLLQSLGASVSVEKEGGKPVVAGAACPLAKVVRDHPESCELVRAALARSTGSPVETRCHHGAAPRCRFALG